VNKNRVALVKVVVYEKQIADHDEGKGDTIKAEEPK
jgi:hypothetical protein